VTIVRAGARRAITLFEVAVAIALLLVLVAIALPSMLGELSQRRFDAAVDAVAAALLLARARGQEMQQPIDVLYVEDDAGGRWIEARTFTADEPLREAGDGERPSGFEPWLRHLPEGVRIDGGSKRDDEPNRDALDAAGPSLPLPALRLALFVADGSALVAAPFRLVDDEGRTAQWRIDPWTGLPAWEEIEPSETAP
jgi:type II secretory pathway pseudopilin PulG